MNYKIKMHLKNFILEKVKRVKSIGLNMWNIYDRWAHLEKEVTGSRIYNVVNFLMI